MNRKITIHFLLIINLVLCGASSCFGQNISKHYVAHLNEHSMLYFIDDLEEWKNKEQKSYFKYDMTYETGKDTLTINFSFYDDAPHEIKSLIYGSMSTMLNKIFIDAEKKKYHYRFSGRYSFSDFQQMIGDLERPGIELITTKGTIPLEISERKWRKQQNIIESIFELISLNQ